MAGFRRLALSSAFALATSSGLGAPSSTPPAPRKTPIQIYQGELDGKQVWVELTRTPQGLAGKLGASLHSESAKASLELTLPDSDSPPSVIPRGFASSDCRFAVSGARTEQLEAACLGSLQGPDLVEEGFPELILGTAPQAKGAQFWLRAVDAKVADALATFGTLLQQAKPPDAKACVRTVRIDHTLRTSTRTFVGYWTWELCGPALLSAAKAGKADPGKPVWHETAWLGVVSADDRSVSRVALGQRKFANETLELFDFGRLDTLNVIRIERDGQDAYPTGVTRESELRVYAAPDTGTLTLALGPLSNTQTSGNCRGADLTNELFPFAADSPPTQLIVRSSKTERHSHADSCDSTLRATYRGYRFNPRTKKFYSEQRSDLEALVKAQLPR